jgi:hypothetical protein
MGEIRLQIQARFYSGWKDVIRTDCKNKLNALCFPSLKDCPYKFPSYSSEGWSAHNAVLIFITTEPWESLTVTSLQVDGQTPGIVGCWWKSRMGNQGGWAGMEEKGAPIMPKLPFQVPGYSNAIIETQEYATMPKTVKVNDMVLNVLDGWTNPYSWPVNWVPIATGVGIGAIIGGSAGYLATRKPEYALAAIPGAIVGGIIGWLTS